MDYDRLGDPSSRSAWGEPCIEAGFDEFWDRELFGIKIPEWRHSVVRLIEAAYHSGDGSAVVVADIGCGAAVYARHLIAAGVPFVYHGFDHNESVLKAACKRWSLLPREGVHLHLMDCRQIPWPLEDDSFDVLIWDTTLRFCEDVDAAMSQSARVCRRWIILARTPIERETWCERVRYYGMSQPSPNWHFDRARFEELAACHGLTLTTQFGCDDTHVLSRGAFPDDIKIKPTFRMVRVFHEAYVRERVARLLAERPGRWAIYGAGAHSRWLMSILPDELRKRVHCFVDDSAAPDGSLSGVPVLRPDNVDPSQIVGVLVSSDTLESGLLARARQWFDRPGDVHRLYENLPDGPYDKVEVPDGKRGDSSIREVAKV